MDKSKYNYYDEGGLSHDDIAKAKLTPDEYVGALKYLLYKYLNRMPYKGQEQQDAEKIKIIAEELPIAVKNKEHHEPLKWLEEWQTVTIDKFMDGTEVWFANPATCTVEIVDQEVREIFIASEPLISDYPFNVYFLGESCSKPYTKDCEVSFKLKGGTDGKLRQPGK